MRRFAVGFRLEPGSAAEARKILHDGPPFDIAATSLERCEVFLAEDELIFLLEGPHADQEAERLLATPAVEGQVSRLAPHLSRDAQIPQEVFSWEKPEPLEGLNFSALPGPGDSDGGSVE
jgi:hypothetical protein